MIENAMLSQFSKASRAAVSLAVREYAREDAIPLSEYSSTVKSLRDGDDFGVDWFLVWDAIGTRASGFFGECGEIADLHCLAYAKWSAQSNAERIAS